MENSGLLPSISFVRRLFRTEQVKKTPLVELRMPHLFPYCFRLGLFRFRLSYRQRLRLDLSHSYLFLCSDVFCLFGLKGFLDQFCYFTHILSGLETCNDIAITVDQEFGKIPFYIALRTPIGIGFIKHSLKFWAQAVFFVETLKSLLALKPSVEREFVLAVNIALFELWKFGAEIHATKLGNLLVGAWSLIPKLVARDINNLEPFGSHVAVHLFKLLVLWCKTTFGSGIDNKQYLALVFRETYIVALGIGKAEVIDCCHFLFLRCLVWAGEGCLTVNRHSETSR